MIWNWNVLTDWFDRFDLHAFFCNRNTETTAKQLSLNKSYVIVQKRFRSTKILERFNKSILSYWHLKNGSFYCFKGGKYTRIPTKHTWRQEIVKQRMNVLNWLPVFFIVRVPKRSFSTRNDIVVICVDFHSFIYWFRWVR